MKIIRFILIQTFLSPLLLAQTPSADEILNDAINAIGGQDKLAQIKNYISVTQTVATGAVTKMNMKITETIQSPDFVKQLFEIDKGFRILCLAGDKGWQQVGSEVSELSAVQKREIERGLFRDTINFLIQRDAVGITVKYAGEQKLGGRTLHILEIKNPANNSFTLYIDAETSLIARKTYHGTAEAGFALFEESYSDYRRVAGLMVPHKIVVKTNGKIFIESVLIRFEINKELPEDFFYKKSEPEIQ